MLKTLQFSVYASYKNGYSNELSLSQTTTPSIDKDCVTVRCRKYRLN